MSSEHIIRMMAGTFILSSLALGFFVNQWFYLITAFVGLNLFQSGLTKWCPAVGIINKLGIAKNKTVKGE